MEPTDETLEQFEQNRPRLAAMATRMLGSRSDADDALQEAWLRVSRAHGAAIENVPAWLTTITARVCLNMLRSRHARRVVPFESIILDVDAVAEAGVEHEAVLADSVSVALLVVLETLAPAQRLAFVLHDMFAIPFDEIATIIQRSPDATRQLASRARARLHSRDLDDIARRHHDHRKVVDAFFAAARGGSLDDLLAVLDPDMVLHNHTGSSQSDATTIIRSARNVAARALRFAQPAAELLPVLVNGHPAVLTTVSEQRISLMTFTLTAGRITAIDALTDRERLDALTIKSP